MRTIGVFAFLVAALAAPALATNWPLVPLDSVHPLGNNWGNYQDYSYPPAPYFHNGIDVITPGAEGRRVSAVRHGWVKAWGTIQESLHYRIAVCDTNSSFTGRAEGWLYAHIDASRWHRSLGDEVQEGDSIGYLVPWGGGFDHCHFARISDTGATWQRFPYPTWWFIQNPLTLVRPNTDLLAPVIQNARPNQKFAFCRDNTNNSYLRHDSLVGEVDIIAKVYDKTGATTGDTVWDKLAPYEVDYSIKREDGLVVVPWRIGVQFSNALDGSLVNVVYKADNICRSQGDYESREYYYIVTNSDGDSIIESTDASGVWNTGLVGDTTYWVFVRASDVYGSTTLDSMQVRTRNGVAVAEPPFAVLSQPLRAIQTVGRGGLVSFGTAGSGPVRLAVYDQLGREAARLVDGRLGPGEHRFSFAPAVAGVYFVKLTLDGKDAHTTKLVALR